MLQNILLKVSINIFTLITNKYINTDLHITTSNSWSLWPSCRRQSGDLNFWPRRDWVVLRPLCFSSFARSRSQSRYAVFLSHSSSLPPSPSPFGLLGGPHQTLTGVEVAVRLLGVSRLLEECSASAGWLCRGMVVVEVVGWWGGGPQRVETSWDWTRAAGHCSLWDCQFLMLTGVRSTCVHCALLSQVSHSLIF